MRAGGVEQGDAAILSERTGFEVAKIRSLFLALSKVIRRYADKSVLADLTPTNVTEDLKPVINTVMDLLTNEYDVIAGTNEFSVDGYNLALDEAQEDEFVGIRASDGTFTKAETTYSDLGQVKAKFTEAPEAGGTETVAIALRKHLLKI